MRRAWWLLAAVVLAGCAGPEAYLDSASRAARTTSAITWLLLGMGTAVYVVVLLLIAQAVRRARRARRHSAGDAAGDTAGDGPEPSDDKVPRRLVVYGGIVVPAVILLVLNVISVPLGSSLADPPGAEEDQLVIEVVAEQFWWRVTYPQQGFETANEIHVPAGEEVRLRITSTDVIHSVWVPKLGGKVDATPGHTTELAIEAEEPGRYRGRCTEFCGLAHAQMVIHVEAQERPAFEDWLERQQQPQPEPTDERVAEGREVFNSSSCVYCHTVDGHNAANPVGPDLTHLASRETIAGGIMANNRGNLGGWVVDPQAQKPGNHMPGTQLAGDDLAALLDYLESLE